jgi:heat-inducible transcriptional repressor
MPAPRLTRRQALVLRAVVSSYVGDANPVASERIAHLLPVALSSASVRNTLAELAELGAVEKPHASSGRVPTELGLRIYVHDLVEPRDLGRYERRDLEGSLEEAPPDSVPRAASRLLSERTRQLGFVVPRPDHAVLRSVSLVRLTRDHVLAVLVSRGGAHSRRVLAFPGADDARDLEQIAAALSERVAGRTLRQARERLALDAAALRSHADRLLERALRLGLEAVAPGGAGDGEDVVIATRLALLDQPEFRDPERIRQLFEAVETQERLLAILDGLLETGGVRVTFGNDLDEPGLRHCVLVAAPYGDAGSPIGVLGVIGPSRMDYARIIPLVECLSELLTERLGL